MTKAWSVIGSTAFLMGLALLLFPWPELPSFAKPQEPARRIELPCKPHPSLLLWWDRDNVFHETDGGWSKQGASRNVEYWHNGKKIAARRDIHEQSFKRDEPYVAWRAVIDGKVYVTLANPTEEFKREIERCESLPVEFSAQ